MIFSHHLAYQIGMVNRIKRDQQEGGSAFIELSEIKESQKHLHTFDPLFTFNYNSSVSILSVDTLMSTMQTLLKWQSRSVLKNCCPQIFQFMPSVFCRSICQIIVLFHVVCCLIHFISSLYSIVLSNTLFDIFMYSFFYFFPFFILFSTLRRPVQASI